MVSTSTYNLEINKRDKDRILKTVSKYPASHFAIISSRKSNTRMSFKIAISQKYLFKLDDSLKRRNIFRRFVLN